MAEETTEQFLARRERELSARASALRGQLGSIEAELIKVQRMRGVLREEEQRPASALAKLLAPTHVGALSTTTPLSLSAHSSEALESLAKHPSIESLLSPYAGRTIKDLVIQALIDGFPNGATSAELRDFIAYGYSRTIDPGSLRTQLHRLKAAGILGQEPFGDAWNFRDGKRSLYSMYDHPSSRRDMKELQDDPEAPYQGLLNQSDKE